MKEQDGTTNVSWTCWHPLETPAAAPAHKTSSPSLSPRAPCFLRDVTDERHVFQIIISTWNLVLKHCVTFIDEQKPLMSMESEHMLSPVFFF